MVDMWTTMEKIYPGDIHIVLTVCHIVRVPGDHRGAKTCGINYSCFHLCVPTKKQKNLRS